MPGGAWWLNRCIMYIYVISFYLYISLDALLIYSVATTTLSVYPLPVPPIVSHPAPVSSPSVRLSLPSTLFPFVVGRISFPLVIRFSLFLSPWGWGWLFLRGVAPCIPCVSSLFTYLVSPCPLPFPCPVDPSHLLSSQHSTITSSPLSTPPFLDPTGIYVVRENSVVLQAFVSASLPCPR